MALKTISNYINGELLKSKSGKYLDNINPSTGEVYSLIPDSNKNDINEAVKAAKVAFPLWSDTPANDRSKNIDKNS